MNYWQINELFEVIIQELAAGLYELKNCLICLPHITSFLKLRYEYGKNLVSVLNILKYFFQKYYAIA